MLALGPANEAELLNDKPNDFTEQEFKSALDKVADLENGRWVLKSKAFKELDVFSYREYSTRDRQLAIENAIRAYDKLRLNAAEPEWERLLPLEERGTGKCLSKLQAKIAGGGIQPAKTPRINVHRAEESGRDTPTQLEGDNVPSDKPSNASVKGGESMTRSNSNPGATKSKRVSEKEARAKRLLAKPGSKTAKSAATKPSEKKPLGKESTKIKSSEYVGDSDDEDDNSLVSLTATTAVKSAQAPGTRPISKPAVKRAREDVGDHNLAPANKKPRAPSNTSPQKSSPLASSSPTNVSDMDESSSSNNSSLKRKAASSISSDEPVKKRHQTSSISSDEAISKRHQKSISSTSSSSANSTQGVHQNGCENGNGVNTTRTNVKEKYTHIPQAQRALNAHKFNAFYKSYKQLHLELSMTKTKDRLKMAELLEMQDRLTKLKKEVLKGLDGDEGELEKRTAAY
jgi:RNA polymerase II elongation factor ELL